MRLYPQHLAGLAWLDARGPRPYSPAASQPLRTHKNVLKAIFTWWNGATIGATFHINRRGVFVGQDDTGNRYFEAKDTKDSYDGRKRRWVIFKGYPDASKVPAEWHGWLHHTFEEPPTVEPLKRQAWEKDHLPNLTGTVHAWRPQGSIARGGERQKASGDYEAWRPE
jgi:NADH:ubiquinone oxidoreductase subunit